jgi:hypothetical protein
LFNVLIGGPQEGNFRNPVSISCFIQKVSLKKISKDPSWYLSFYDASIIEDKLRENPYPGQIISASRIATTVTIYIYSRSFLCHSSSR